MDCEEIKLILSKFPLSKNHFAGVFASDTLPDPKQLDLKCDTCFVINLDPSFKPGSHWVCVILKPSCAKNYYFDSYGIKPFIKSICSFLAGKDFIYNNKRLQHPLSTTCGEWCIFFIMCHLSNHSLKCIVDFFENSPDLLLNDYAVTKFVNRISGKKRNAINKQFLENQIAKAMKDNMTMYTDVQ